MGSPSFVSFISTSLQPKDGVVEASDLSQVGPKYRDNLDLGLASEREAGLQD